MAAQIPQQHFQHEIYATALESTETALARLKGIAAPRFPSAALRATEAIARATRELDYAARCIEDSERLEREVAINDETQGGTRNEQ